MADADISIPLPPEASHAMSPAPTDAGHSAWWYLGWMVPQVREARIRNMQLQHEQDMGVQTIAKLRSMGLTGESMDGGGAQGQPQAQQAPQIAARPMASAAPVPTVAPWHSAMPMSAMPPPTQTASVGPGAGMPASGTFTVSHPALPDNSSDGLANFLSGLGLSTASGRDPALANPNKESVAAWEARHPQGSAPTTEAPPPGTPVTEGLPPSGTTPSTTPLTQVAQAPHGNGLRPGEAISMHLPGGINYAMRGESADQGAAQTQAWINVWSDKYGELLTSMPAPQAMQQAQLWATRQTHFVPAAGTASSLTSMTAEPKASAAAKPTKPNLYSDFKREFEAEHGTDAPGIADAWATFQGKIAREKSEAKAKYGPLSENVQKTVAGSQEVIRMLDEVEKIAKTPEGRKRIGFIVGNFSQGKYGVGLENDPLAVTINTLAQRTSLIGGSEIMRAAGTRAVQALNQMQVHFSHPYDNPVEFLTKMRENRKSILNLAELAIRTATTSPKESLKRLKALERPDEAPAGSTPNPTAPADDFDSLMKKYGN